MKQAPAWLSEGESQVWRSWLRLSAALPAALHRQLQADSDLSLQDFDVLVQLTEAPDRQLRVAALADAVHWERSRLSHHLKRMEGRGLVQRIECTDDGRGFFVSVTRAGMRALAAAAPGHVASVRDLFFGALTEREAKSLGVLVAKVLARVEQVGAE